jgi:FkbM family methyltransferase
VADSPHKRALGRARTLAAHPRIVPLTALLLRARTVHPGPAFALREVARVSGARSYRLRGGGDLRAVIRHGTGDVVTLGEVFHERDYEPPPDVAAALGRVHTILDLGANIGLFGLFAARRWPDAEILAYEPDPANADVHERAIALNGLGQRWRLVRAAAGARDGRVSFVSGGVALSRLADADAIPLAAGERTIEVDLRDVLAQVADADLLKLDTEGGEWAILTDPRFRAAPPRALALEYHPALCPGPDPRAAAVAALEQAGMTVRVIKHRADGYGMLWAWRT